MTITSQTLIKEFREYVDYVDKNIIDLRSKFSNFCDKIGGDDKEVTEEAKTELKEAIDSLDTKTFEATRHIQVFEGSIARKMALSEELFKQQTIEDKSKNEESDSKDKEKSLIKKLPLKNIFKGVRGGDLPARPVSPRIASMKAKFESDDKPNNIIPLPRGRSKSSFSKAASSFMKQLKSMGPKSLQRRSVLQPERVAQPTPISPSPDLDKLEEKAKANSNYIIKPLKLKLPGTKSKSNQNSNSEKDNEIEKKDEEGTKLIVTETQVENETREHANSELVPKIELGNINLPSEVRPHSLSVGSGPVKASPRPSPRAKEITPRKMRKLSKSPDRGEAEISGDNGNKTIHTKTHEHAEIITPYTTKTQPTKLYLAAIGRIMATKTDEPTGFFNVRPPIPRLGTVTGAKYILDTIMTNDQNTDKIRPNENIWDFYTLQGRIGQPGSLGSAYSVLDKKTNERYAVKSISKASLKRKTWRQLQREVAIMAQLKPHPNVIDFISAFEDDDFLHIVMEICDGGELFDRISQSQRLTEKIASKIFNQLVSAVEFLHENQIIHRDIKPDNFLFKSPESDTVKLIDFGLAKWEAFGEFERDPCGTPYYVAPEVLKHKYDTACDVWSLGVLLFVMLFGYPPFHPDPKNKKFAGLTPDEQTLTSVCIGFDPTVKAGFGAHFPERFSLSKEAQNIISDILVKDVVKRPTAKELLSRQWVKGENISDTQIDENVITALRKFDSGNKFKQAVLFALVDKVDETALKTLKDTFISMDTNQDGKIQVNELQNALYSSLQPSSKTGDVWQIMGNVDLDGTMQLSYEELLVAVFNQQICSRYERLVHTFEVLDENGDGKISREELEKALESSNVILERTTVDELIQSADKDGDGNIDFDEFLDAFLQPAKTKNREMKFKLISRDLPSNLYPNVYPFSEESDT